MGSLRGGSPATVTAYGAYLRDFLGFMTGHHGAQLGLAPLQRLGPRDMRAWMAAERAQGLGARSLARKLSAVKSFYRWWAERDGFDATAVLSTRSPKFQRKLPRPLFATAAKELIDTVEAQDGRDWVSARDVAIVTLLYGCGLRRSEAIGLTGAVLPLGEALRILGKGKLGKWLAKEHLTHHAIPDFFTPFVRKLRLAVPILSAAFVFRPGDSCANIPVAQGRVRARRPGTCCTQAIGPR